MGIQSGTEKRAALAYAASQGWVPPEAIEREIDARKFSEIAVRVPAGHFVFTEDPRPALEAKVADLEVALAAERESHEVTKKALERARRKGRVGELEKALAKLASDDVTEADLDAAKALLK